MTGARRVLALLIGGVLTMATAPHAAGWLLRLGNRPGPYTDAASAPGGIPFLTDAFGPTARIIVEAAFGADLTANPDLWNWYDITADVRQADGQRVAIAPMGRADEASLTQPAGAGFQLDNTRGDYSAYNPAGKWYPYVKRNTPIRVRLYLNGIYSTRFQGKANGWVPSWDTSGNLAVVTVSASGELRRLQQGKTPLHSPLYRAVGATNPTGFWSLEDTSGSTQAGSAVSGVAALKGTDTSVSFGTATGAAGSAPVADFTNGGRLSAAIGNTTSTSWSLFVTEKVALTGGDRSAVIGWTTTGGASAWTILVDLNGLYVEQQTATGVVTTQVFSTTANPGNGQAHRIRVSANPTLNVVQVYVDDILNEIPVDMTGITFGHLTAVTVNPRAIGATNVNKNPTALGAFAFWDGAYPAGSTISSAFAGYAGETCTARLARLCGEEGIRVDIRGTSTTTMGAQGADTLLNLLRECEATDLGVLADGLGPGLRYVTRQTRYNMAAALTADMSAGQVDDPFEPVDDDQRNRNLYKVDRKNGSFAVYEDVTGPLGTNAIGTYDSSASVNTQTDSVLYYMAAFLTHLGTVEGLRYPTLNLDLAAAPALAPAWIGAGDSSRADVTHVQSEATQHPPEDLRLLVEGYAESLSPFDWEVKANCAPYAPYVVGVLGSVDRVDTDGSSVAGVAAAGSGSLSIASTGKVWSVTAGSYPNDFNIGGIRVTVTAMTGATSPQTATVDPTTVTKQLNPGDAVKLWQPLYPAL